MFMARVCAIASRTPELSGGPVPFIYVYIYIYVCRKENLRQDRDPE